MPLHGTALRKLDRACWNDDRSKPPYPIIPSYQGSILSVFGKVVPETTYPRPTVIPERRRHVEQQAVREFYRSWYRSMDIFRGGALLLATRVTRWPITPATTCTGEINASSIENFKCAKSWYDIWKILSTQEKEHFFYIITEYHFQVSLDSRSCRFLIFRRISCDINNLQVLFLSH